MTSQRKKTIQKDIHNMNTRERRLQIAIDTHTDSRKKLEKQYRHWLTRKTKVRRLWTTACTQLESELRRLKVRVRNCKKFVEPAWVQFVEAEQGILVARVAEHRIALKTAEQQLADTLKRVEMVQTSTSDDMKRALLESSRELQECEEKLEFAQFERAEKGIPGAPVAQANAVRAAEAKHQPPSGAPAGCATYTYT